MSNNINDFGEKIGGARKDLWKSRGLMLEDLENMNEAEKGKYITKDNIWSKPDYQKMVDDGMDKSLVYFIKSVRDCIPKAAPANNQENYITFVSNLRDALLDMKNIWEVKDFFNNFFVEGAYIQKNGYHCEVNSKYRGCIDNKLAEAAQQSWRTLHEKVVKKQFCYTEDEKLLANYSIIKKDDSIKYEKDWNGEHLTHSFSAGGLIMNQYYYYSRGLDITNLKENSFFVLKGNSLVAKDFETDADATKWALDTERRIVDKTEALKKERTDDESERRKKYIPPQLENIQRDGPSVRKGNVEGLDYLSTFKFRGGEFGNWLNDNDRQASLNMGYEALCDLRDALKISNEDVSYGGKLAIAFGARGVGSALAHYEPLLKVINLTKMKGAGSLGHEWFHGFDDYLGVKLGFKDFLSKQSSYRIKEVLPSFYNLIEKMKYKDTIVKNDSSTEYDKAIKGMKEWIEYWLPDSQLTPAEKELKENTVKDMIENSTDSSKMVQGSMFYGDRKFAGFGEADKHIESLSSIRKASKINHVIPAKGKSNIMKWRASIARAAKQLEPHKECVNTDFYQRSITCDKNYAKTDNGYWQSDIEMLARAFACYLTDKLPYRSDYLNGHSEYLGTPDAPIPQGEERKIINQCFDEMFAEVKEKGLLHEQIVKQETLESYIENSKKEQENIKENKTGQFVLDGFSH